MLGNRRTQPIRRSSLEFGAAHGPVSELAPGAIAGGMLPLFFVVHGLWTALHAYVGLRLLGPLPLRRTARNLLYLLVALLAGTSPLVLFADLMLGPGPLTVHARNLSQSELMASR